MSTFQVRYPQTLADVLHFTREALEKATRLSLKIFIGGFLETKTSPCHFTYANIIYLKVIWGPAEWHGG